VDKRLVGVWHDKPPQNSHHANTKGEHQHNLMGVKDTFGSTLATITGYACACTPYTDQERSRPGRSYHDHSRDDERGNHVAAEPGSNIVVTETVRIYHWEEWDPPPTRPAVILDPFGGTGTVALVAKALGRHGISLDMSSDYCRLAGWRTTDEGEYARALQVDKPAKQVDGQLSLLEAWA
jgi:hypothetical protein